MRLAVRDILSSLMRLAVRDILSSLMRLAVRDILSSLMRLAIRDALDYSCITNQRYPLPHDYSLLYITELPCGRTLVCSCRMATFIDGIISLIYCRHYLPLYHLCALPIRLCALSIRLYALSIRLCALPIRLCALPIRLCALSVRLRAFYLCVLSIEVSSSIS